eukprot:7230712-Lingulodinium_polyedra.AAC.1
MPWTTFRCLGARRACKGLASQVASGRAEVAACREAARQRAPAGVSRRRSPGAGAPQAPLRAA